MAIKVSGTSVIDDSRNLQNIASIDATTEAAITSAGFTKTTGDITGVTAGGGMTGGGTSGTVTISHADTSSRSSVNNSGNTVIQDIYLDTYGHVTAINSTTISASPSTSLNAVGTYALLYHSSAKNPGTTVSGNFCRYANCAGRYPNTPTPSGSWRCMGYTDSSSNDGKTSVWVRYA